MSTPHIIGIYVRDAAPSPWRLFCTVDTHGTAQKICKAIRATLAARPYVRTARGHFVGLLPPDYFETGISFLAPPQEKTQG